MAAKNALHYVVIVPIFVHYVQDYVQEIRNIQKSYVLYVLKFAKLVLKNVLNMLLITKVAKLVLKLVKNVLRLVHNKA
jgi:hypothetical protein